MKVKIFFFVLCLMLFSCQEKSRQISSYQVSDKFIYHWNSEFNDTIKIKNWLNKVFVATQNTLGEFPFDVHVFIAMSDQGGEPVPWAHTDRGDSQSVYFYIDTSYSIDDYLNDWTAPHELSHLTIPFLGKKYSWLSEGYATFMQCQILNEIGQMTEKQVNDKYNSKILKVKKNFLCSSPFVDVVDSLRLNHNYPAMYWGSVNYFIQADTMLKRFNYPGLIFLIREYQKCCRLNDKSIQDLIFSLDSLNGNKIFNNLLQSYINKPAKTLFK